MIFNESRISTLPECWRIIESCSVSLRGWNYPHVDREGKVNGNDWISSWCEFNGFGEILALLPARPALTLELAHSREIAADQLIAQS